MRETLIVLKIALILLWPVSAIAAQLTFSHDLSDVPLLHVAVTLLLSTLSGLTSLLSQMLRDYQAGGTIERLGLYIASKMMGSNMAGLAAMFGAGWMHLDRDLQGLGIIICAFGGTWLLERALASWSDKYLPKGGAQ